MRFVMVFLALVAFACALGTASLVHFEYSAPASDLYLTAVSWTKLAIVAVVFFAGCIMFGIAAVLSDLRRR